MKIYYDKGTIIVNDLEQTSEKPDYLVYDARIQLYRAPAYKYPDLKKRYYNVEDRVFEGAHSISSSTQKN